MWDPKNPGKPLKKNDDLMECMNRHSIWGYDWVDPDLYENVGHVGYDNLEGLPNEFAFNRTA